MPCLDKNNKKGKLIQIYRQYFLAFSHRLLLSVPTIHPFVSIEWGFFYMAPKFFSNTHLLRLHYGQIIAVFITFCA